jgi:hypothetical protein
MGTDIFLKWDGMTEQERAQQLAASKVFALDAGRIGYLRAAIGMKRESALLRSVFPSNYWYNMTDKALPFDFRARLSVLNAGAKAYIRSVKQGIEPDLEDYALVPAMDRAPNDMAERAGFQRAGGTEDLESDAAKERLLEVAEFFQLGVRKQEAGLNPAVFISW